MSVISFEVDDDIAKAIGLSSIKAYIEKQISLLKLEYLSDEIGKSISESGMNLEEEMEKARQEVWNENKDKYLGKIQ
ncbi:MAG: hypothetical protein U0457_10755 [Candidatus Sericytochromatia bacterium]